MDFTITCTVHTITNPTKTIARNKDASLTFSQGLMENEKVIPKQRNIFNYQKDMTGCPYRKKHEIPLKCVFDTMAARDLQAFTPSV